MFIILTLVIGVVAAVMRTFELHLAWDTEKSLMRPYHPSSLSLLIFSIAFTLLALLISRSAPALTGKRVAAPRHVPLYMAVDFLAAMALILSGVLDIVNKMDDIKLLFDPIPGLTGSGLSTLVFALLSLFAGISVLLIMRAASKGVLGRAYGFYMTVPIFWAALWLILDFSKHAVNPVPLSFLYEMLGIIFTLLSLYSSAGFFFNLPRMRHTIVYSILGAYFSIITVFGLVFYRFIWGVWPVDNINWSDFARFVFSILHLLATVYIVRGQKFDIFKSTHRERVASSAS